MRELPPSEAEGLTDINTNDDCLVSGPITPITKFPGFGDENHLTGPPRLRLHQVPGQLSPHKEVGDPIKMAEDAGGTLPTRWIGSRGHLPEPIEM